MPGDEQGGSVFTFLVTDIEGSTALWAHSASSMERLLARHDELLHDAVARNGGTVFKGTGDGILSVFDDANAAVRAARDAQRAFAAEAWPDGQSIKVRMGLDTGSAQERSGDYFGPPLNRVMRMMASGHGGQVLLTEPARAATHVETVELGAYDYKGIGRVTVHQLVLDGPQEFPELRTDRTPPAETRAGFAESIRGYDLRQVLGEGDFGVVYQAHQSGVGREVAIKVIRPEYANQPSFIKRFEIEAKFVAQLEHPYIVPLYDFWRDPDGAYIVMRMLRGGSLRQAIERAAWHPQAAMALLEQVGAALAYAHRNGVIHRDIKPENVLLDEEGNAYLSDFGIAVHQIDSAGQPVSSSKAYISPEERVGQRLTAQTDIFSLGVLAHELLTGVRPEPGVPLPPMGSLRPELPAGLDEVVERATADDPAARFAKVEDLLGAVRQAVGEPVAKPTAEPIAVRNPYKGLRAFQETDRADFFGRTSLVNQVIDTVRTRPLTAVVGPSGSGKSSIVRAGVLPPVRDRALGADTEWLIAMMFPGSYPFEELGSALLRVAVDRPSHLIEDLAEDERGLVRVAKRVLPDDGSHLLLIIDQFEELFSLSSPRDRALLLDSLVALAGDARSRVKVVLTLRADYFGYPLGHPEFAKLLRDGLVAVAMPDDEELAEAIVRPAEGVGLDLEPGLVAAIVSDVVNQPGGLPLLQYALTELVGRRDGRRLTMDAYRATGGVLGALAQRAEDTFLQLDSGGREAAKQLFLRLVSVDEHSDDTRRRVRRTDLATLGFDTDDLDRVIEDFGTHRLLSFDVDPVTREPTIEVAHEALIREWDRLYGWIGEHREDLVLEQRLDGEVRDWLDAERDPSYLLRGSQLDQFEEWAADSEVLLSEVQSEYLGASQAARREAAAREAERQAHERELELRSQRRLRILVAVMAIAAVVAGTLGFIAARQAGEAASQRDEATLQRDQADQLRAQAEEQQAILDQQVVAFEAEALAEKAMQLTAEDPVLAARLAEEAIAAAHESQVDLDRAVAALHIALQDLGVQFPEGRLDTTTVLGPTNVRGVFVLPIRTLFELSEAAGIGVLTGPQCTEHLGGPCRGTPRERLPSSILDSTILESTGRFTSLEGTDLRYAASYAFTGDPGSTTYEWAAARSEGILEELHAFGAAVGVDPVGQDVTDISGGDPLTADFAITYASEAAGWLRFFNSLEDPTLTFTIESGDVSDLGFTRISIEPFDVDRWLQPEDLAGKEPAVLTDALRSEVGLFGLWFEWHPWVVAYRADVFENEALVVPQTWDELLGISAELADRGFTPWCFGALDADVEIVAMISSVLLGTDPALYDQWLTHEIRADDPRVVEAFGRLEELFFSPGHVELLRSRLPGRRWDQAAVDLTAATPGCLMWFANSLEIGAVQAPLGTFRLPVGGPESSSMLTTGSVAVFSKDRPETREFAQWMATDWFGSVYSATGQSAPANIGLRDSVWDLFPDGSSQATGQAALLTDLVESAASQDQLRADPYSGPWIPEAVLEPLARLVDRWVREGLDAVPEALADVEAAWQEWEASRQG